MSDTRKYQNENPVDVDLFGGKGHEQVARAIANVLISDSSQHLIGIEGSLGAGKSTVIKIIDGLVKPHNFQMVTFDADRYHTNLKPALISLIEAELKVLIGKNDKYRLAKLTTVVEVALGKRFEYTKETSSNVPIPSVIFAFLLIASAFQTKPTLEFFFKWMGNVADLNKLTGFASLLIWISPALFYGVMKFCGNNIKLGDLVKKNSEDKIKEVINVNREVGAMELREAFGTFASLIPKGKALVLVIDNIDRVSPEIARELWSDLEILTSLGSKQFRILLPYSEEHLARALEKSSDDESASGKEFISKRIPVPFAAPPIVTTGWREQFDEYWSDTLPEIDGKDGVKDLIDIWAPKVTPRYLKSLVNRIGAKIDSCPEPSKELNGASCAAYLMSVRDKGVNILDFLSSQERSTLHDEDIRKVKASHKVLTKHAGQRDIWAKQVSALHFQTTFEIAQSELISEPIRAAFNAYDSDAIIDLSSLLGFEVFFKQKIESTHPSDLIKVFDAVVQADEEDGLISMYLKDINHELQNAIDEEYSYDQELIDSYKNLQDSNIDISLKIPKSDQHKVTKQIMELWKELNALKPGSLYEYEQDLMEALKECYAYSQITGMSPSFIRKPIAEFIVRVLYDMAGELKGWDIEGLLSKLNLVELFTVACRHQTSSVLANSILKPLMGRMQVGLLDEVEVHNFVETIDVRSALLSELVSLMPYSREWFESDDSGVTQRLIDRYYSDEGSDYTDDVTLEAYLCLCIASSIREFAPHRSINFINVNNQRVSQRIDTWLSDELVKYDNSLLNLPDFLAFTKLEKILSWCKESEISNLLLPALETLISDCRVNRLNVDSFLTDNYVYMRDNFVNISASELLDWFGPWAKFIKKSFLDWNDVLIDDVLTHRPVELFEVLTSHFDSQELSENDWHQRMKLSHQTFRVIAKSLAESGYKVKNQKVLHAALKSAPFQETRYDAELLGNLALLLDGPKQSGIRTTLRSKLFKVDTTNEQRSRIIDFFPNLVTMPSISGEVMEQEVTVFLEEVISKKNAHELDWLMSQPKDKSGWNLESWSQEGIKGLQEVFENDPEQHTLKVYGEFLDFLNKLNAVPTI